jgi:hypothetical protein
VVSTASNVCAVIMVFVNKHTFHANSADIFIVPHNNRCNCSSLTGIIKKYILYTYNTVILTLHEKSLKMFLFPTTAIRAVHLNK